MRGPGKGVSNNPAGKPKGAQNRTTKEAKELLEQILLGEVDNIKSALDAVMKKDPAKYLDACSKLFTYVLPKKTDLTSGGNPIKPDMNIMVVDEQTKNEVKRLLNEHN